MMNVLKAVLLAAAVPVFWVVVAVVVFNAANGYWLWQAIGVLCLVYGVLEAALAALNAYNRRLDRQIARLMDQLRAQREGEHADG